MEGIQRVHWVVLHAKPLNLLLPTMTKVCREILLQMVLQSASEKGVASVTSTHLHVDTVLHLQSGHLAVPIVMGEEIFMKGTVIGIQATELIMSAHVTEVHREAEAHQDTMVEEVEVGAFLAVQVIVAVTGIIAEARVQHAVRVQ